MHIYSEIGKPFWNQLLPADIVDCAYADSVTCGHQAKVMDSLHAVPHSVPGMHSRHVSCTQAVIMIHTVRLVAQ